MPVNRGGNEEKTNVLVFEILTVTRKLQQNSGSFNVVSTHDESSANFNRHCKFD